MKNKKGQSEMTSRLVKYIIIFFVLVAIIFFIALLTGKGQAALDYLKNLITFKR